MAALAPSDVCVLIPTCYRIDGLRRTVRTLYETAPLAHSAIACEADDDKAIEFAEENNIPYAICTPPLAGAANAWNIALSAAKDYKAYFTGSDDIIFHPGWLAEVLHVLSEQLNNFGLVGINDKRKGAKDMTYFKSRADSFVTHYLFTREWMIKFQGGVAAVPHYFCNWTDVESTQRALRSGHFAMANKAIVEHDWKGGAKSDACYKRAFDARKDAERVWKDRLARGLPDDFEAVIK